MSNKLILILVGLMILLGLMPGCTLKFHTGALEGEADGPGLHSKSSVPALSSETTVDPVAFGKWFIENSATLVKFTGTQFGL